MLLQYLYPHIRYLCQAKHTVSQYFILQIPEYIPFLSHKYFFRFPAGWLGKKTHIFVGGVWHLTSILLSKTMTCIIYLFIISF